MAEHYTEQLAGRRDVAVINMSLDDDPVAAARFGTKHALSWLTVLKEKREALGPHFEVKAIPTYKLVSSEGEVLAEGRQGVLAALENFPK